MRNDRKGSSFTESHLTYWSRPKARTPRPVVPVLKQVAFVLVLVIIASYWL